MDYDGQIDPSLLAKKILEWQLVNWKYEDYLNSLKSISLYIFGENNGNP